MLNIIFQETRKSTKLMIILYALLVVNAIKEPSLYNVTSIIMTTPQHLSKILINIRVYTNQHYRHVISTKLKKSNYV